jgi:predicted DNA-binding protein
MASDTFPGEAELVAAAKNLTYVDTGETEQDLLAKLPPVPDEVDDMLVVTSLRIPLGLHNRLKEYATAHGVKPSVLIRQWIELHLSADDDRPILLADAIRALASLRPAA